MARGSSTLGLESLETTNHVGGGAWNVDELTLLILDLPWPKEKKFELKICRKF